MPADAAFQGKSDIRQAASQAPFPTEPGRPHPLGATVDKEGVNFSVFSRNATTVELLLFERQDDVQPIQIIKLDPPNPQTSTSRASSLALFTPTVSMGHRISTA